MKVKTLFLFFIFSFSFLYANFEKSVVRISSQIQVYDYKKPWLKAKTKNIIGSGAVIKKSIYFNSCTCCFKCKNCRSKEKQ